MSDQNGAEIRLERRANVAILTWDNVKRRNAMSRRLRQQLLKNLDCVLDASDECEAVVITGAGGHFSAGADISEMGKRTMLQSRVIMTETCESVRRIVGGAKPVVAAVEGVAFGLGFSFACACDYVIASREARFCAAFLRVALVPDTGILWSLQQKAGSAKARELLALTTEIDAEEAARIGVVDRVAEPGCTVDEAVRFCDRFSGSSPMSMAFIKAGLTHGSASLDDAVNTEIDYQSILRSSNDYQEALRAISEQREPKWTGR